MEQITDQYKKQFSPYYLEQIINLEGNTNSFLNKIEGEEQYIKNYFTDILQQKEDLFFEQQLYSQVISCLFYTEQINKDQIKNQNREAFSEKFTPIDFNKKEFEKLQISDKEIQQLKCFLNMLISELYQIKEEINEFKINLNVLGVMVKINELKLEMIGCEYSCPLCKRKCDLSNEIHESICVKMATNQEG